jgi:DNA polymerase-3 subunit beta
MTATVIHMQAKTLQYMLHQVATVAGKAGKGLPVLQCVLLRFEGRRASAIATNLEQQNVVTIEGETDVPAAAGIVVQCAKLLSLVSLLPGDSMLEIRYESGIESARFKSKTGKFTLNSLPTSLFPEFDVQTGERGRVSLSSNVLKSALTKITSAMAVNDHRYFLCGCLFEFSENVMNLVTSDGHRLSRAEFEIDADFRGSFILPRDFVTDLMRKLPDKDDPVDMTFFDRSALFRIGSQFSMQAKLIDGRFPDWRRVTPDPGDADRSKFSVISSEFGLALKRVAILSDEKSKPVKISVLDEIIDISMDSPDGETAQEAIEYIGPPNREITIGFNAKYLQDVAAHIEGDMECSMSNDNAIFWSGNGSITHVVMPLRL